MEVYYRLHFEHKACFFLCGELLVRRSKEEKPCKKQLIPSDRSAKQRNWASGCIKTSRERERDHRVEQTQHLNIDYTRPS